MIQPLLELVSNITGHVFFLEDILEATTKVNRTDNLQMIAIVLQIIPPCNVQLFRPFRTHQHCYFTHGSDSFPGCVHIFLVSICARVL